MALDNVNMFTMVEDFKKKFVGSLEEKILRQSLNAILNNNLKFLTLVLKSCNVLSGGAFTEASVELTSFSIIDALREGEHDKKFVATAKELDRTAYVHFEDLFKSSLFQDIADNGLQKIPDKYLPTFQVLLEYLHNIKPHQQALEEMRTGRDEASIAAVMAEHLFSRLIPGFDYLLQSGQKKKCPCPQKEVLKAGCTSLGSNYTWHGIADLLLNHTVAVSLLDHSDADEVDDDSEKDEPPTKKVKSSATTTSKYSLLVEVKNKSSNRSVLFSKKVLSQVLSETIVNGFSQVNQNQSLSGRLIPTIGCTIENIIVFMYDPKNDVLVQLIDLIPIWESPSILDIESIITLWIILNFKIFTIPDLADSYDVEKSKFHEMAEEKIKYYQDLECKPSLPFRDVELYENALFHLKKYASRAKRKEISSIQT